MKNSSIETDEQINECEEKVYQCFVSNHRPKNTQASIAKVLSCNNSQLKPP